MSTIIPVPLEWVESVAELRLPESADRRLQLLMDRNTDGSLTPEESEELKALVDLSESLSLVRARALHSLGKKPE